MADSVMARLRDRLLYGVLGQVPRDRPFVFGIGLSKTGTTSLSDALEVLGYRAFHLPPVAKVSADGTIRADFPWWVWKYDAMTDLTVAVLHAELRRDFPNARFIYTHRDLGPWLASCARHFTQELRDRRIAQGQSYLAPLVRAFYGSELFEEAGFRAAYLRHAAEVAAVHEGHANFLRYDLTAGEGWAPLCAFLGHPVPDRPFPKSNTAGRG